MSKKVNSRVFWANLVFMGNLFQEILEQEFAKRKERNNKYSLRAFARDMEISPASLLKVFNGGHLYINSINKVLSRLPEVSEPIKKDIRKGQHSKNYFEHHINSAFSGLKIAWEHKYVLPGTATIRVLKRFFNFDNELSFHFEDNFFSNERQVAARGFFTRREDGLYKCYLAENFETKGPANWDMKKNDGIRVDFDSEGFPKIFDVSMSIIGKNQYIFGDMIYSKENFKVSGRKYEFDGTEKGVCEIVYDNFPDDCRKGN